MRKLRNGLERLLSPVEAQQDVDQGADIPEIPASARGARWIERLVIRAEGRFWFVPVAEIEWVEAADYNVRVHTSQQTYTTRISLSHLAERLDPLRFVRVHRSSIVNLDRVRQVLPYVNGAYTLVLQDGTEIRLSRSMRPVLEEALGQAL
jgi:two-component system LytT family response regulator